MKTNGIPKPPGFHVQQIRDSLTGKQMRTWRHRSGMMIKMLPRPGFSKKFAAITVPYGSIHQSFRFAGRQFDVPAGAAHFLEHCIFSRDDKGGLLGQLSALGASANAYTTHTHTMYYFSTVSNFEEALRVYFDAVLHPYLEPDRVEVERPVILAELSQYLDDPDNRCYMKLLDNLYLNHPAGQDIGGTLDSVRELTDVHVKQIHQAYYHPGSISLTLAGEFDESSIIDWLAGVLPDQPAALAELCLPDEPAQTATNQSRLTMDVSSPSFLLGVKDGAKRPSGPLYGLDLIERQRAARLVFDTLLSPASPIYEQLFAEGLINDSFGYHYSCETSFAFLAAGGESPRPVEAAEKLTELLQKAIHNGINRDLFEIQKRAAAGDFVRSLDSIEHSGMVQAQCNLHGVDLFDYPMLYDRMEAEAALAMLGFLSDFSNYTMTVLEK